MTTFLQLGVSVMYAIMKPLLSLGMMGNKYYNVKYNPQVKLSLSSNYHIFPFKRFSDTQKLKEIRRELISLMVNLKCLLFVSVTFATRDCLISEKEAGLSLGLSRKQRSNTSQKWEGHK